MTLRRLTALLMLAALVSACATRTEERPPDSEPLICRQPPAEPAEDGGVGGTGATAEKSPGENTGVLAATTESCREAKPGE